MFRVSDSELKCLYSELSKFAKRWGTIGVCDVDDLVQDSMLKVLARKNEKMPTPAWLRLVMRSVAISTGREAVLQKKHVAVEDNSLTVSEQIERGAGRYFCEPKEIDIDLLLRLKQVLSSLSPAHKQVLILYSEGLTYKQIAEITNTDLGTVRSRLSYARRYARKQLTDLS